MVYLINDYVKKKLYLITEKYGVRIIGISNLKYLSKYYNEYIYEILQIEMKTIM